MQNGGNQRYVFVVEALEAQRRDDDSRKFGPTFGGKDRRERKMVREEGERR
jgi:hypothetical protein